ncbi:hypothetical protein ES705_32612 [subsurface metagenome]
MGIPSINFTPSMLSIIAFPQVLGLLTLLANSPEIFVLKGKNGWGSKENSEFTSRMSLLPGVALTLGIVGALAAPL